MTLNVSIYKKMGEGCGVVCNSNPKIKMLALKNPLWADLDTKLQTSYWLFNLINKSLSRIHKSFNNPPYKNIKKRKDVNLHLKKEGRTYMELKRLKLY